MDINLDALVEIILEGLPSDTGVEVTNKDIGLLTLRGVQGPVIGDLWSIGQPIGFGMSFIAIEEAMEEHPDNPLTIAAAQMVTVFFATLVWWAAFTPHDGPINWQLLQDPGHIFALGYTGFITSALAVVLESYALRYVKAEDATIILSTEPLWATLLASFWLGETLNAQGVLGMGVIIAGCIISQVDPKKYFPSKKSN